MARANERTVGYPVLSFHQFRGTERDDELLLFAAPAKALAAWAGVPRKGWHIRMLFQRWVTKKRESELAAFWRSAATREPDGFILGPTAVTVAIQGEPVINKAKILLRHTPVVDVRNPPRDTLSPLAALALDAVKPRLDASQALALEDFARDPFAEPPEVGHDYVFEFALQLTQMVADGGRFIVDNNIGPDDAAELVTALEAISRPAIVVDGQHRLIGAAATDAEVWLPVVAMPHSTWTDQIYQFVVINEKAQKIDTSLLTDIFGSSLTKREQLELRKRLARADVAIEGRIAAVIAGRTDESPFVDMVQVNLPGKPPEGISPFIPEVTIRQLIDGGRGARGWRSDEEFYDTYVRPRFPNRYDWDSWTEGAWRLYWFAFWSEVASFYNAECGQIKEFEKDKLWSKTEQTNLTKAVTLRLFQRLFIEYAIGEVAQVQKNRSVLIKALGEEAGNEKVAELELEAAIPADVEAFRKKVREDFLIRGVPVRFFTTDWEKSLDDPAGQEKVLRELKKALEYAQEGKRWHINPHSIWVPKASRE